MAREISTTKTSRVNRSAASASPADVSAYCRDLDNWPQSWMGLEKDLPPGEALLACLRPFIEHLASSTLSHTTIRRHVANLWLLGGEIIRDLHYDASLRKKPAEQLLRKVIHEDVSFTTAPRNSSVPSTPPAANSTAFSHNLSTDPGSHPQIPPTRRKTF
jgi:hypothetical protein